VGVARIDATHETVQLQFEKNAPVDPKRIVAMVQKSRNRRLAGPDRLRVEAKMPEWPQRVQAVKQVLGELAA